MAKKREDDFLDRLLENSKTISAQELTDMIGSDENVPVEVVKETEVLPAEPVEVLPEITHSEESLENLNDDYELARQNIQSLVKKGQKNLDELLELASKLEHPRAYEVVAQYLKVLGEQSVNLIELSKKVEQTKDISEKKGKAQNVTNNAYFMGTTTELLEKLEEAKKKK